MITSRLRVLIVGCGNIAGGTGLERLEGEALSHAAAYTADDRFEISCCVDPNEDRANQFKQNWSVGSAYKTLEEALENENIFDVASICVPSEVHAEILWKLVNSSVRLVLCEKPFTTDLSEAKKLVAAFKQKNKPIAVAYTRRWHRGLRKIGSELDEGIWGQVGSVHARYTWGILNTGGHIIDMLHSLLGPMEVHYAGNLRYDYSRKDPTLDAILKTRDNIPIHLIGGDGRNFRFFEVELLTKLGSITFEDWGTTVRRRQVSPYRYAPYIKTLEPGNWEEFGAGGSFEAMVDNIYQTIANDAPLASDGLSALATHSIVQEAINFATDAKNLG